MISKWLAYNGLVVLASVCLKATAKSVATKKKRTIILILIDCRETC